MHVFIMLVNRCRSSNYVLIISPISPSQKFEVLWWIVVEREQLLLMMSAGGVSPLSKRMKNQPLR